MRQQEGNWSRMWTMEGEAEVRQAATGAPSWKYQAADDNRLNKLQNFCDVKNISILQESSCAPFESVFHLSHLFSFVCKINTTM